MAVSAPCLAYLRRYCYRVATMLTDAKIQASVRAVASGRRATATLSDPAPRGAGRLLLIVKPGRAEWYAQRFVDGRRRLQKLGAYPALTLAGARERFAGHRPAAGRHTVGALLDAYLATLAGRPSERQARSVLRSCGAVIGRSRLARDVTPADVVACVKPSFMAGRRAMAAKHRMFLAAAFRWAILSTHDYRSADARDWGLTANPCDAVPVDHEATRPGDRWLSVSEFREVLAWALAGAPGSARFAVAVMMLTGQRVSEILRLRAGQWDGAERVLHWPTTKSGKPHTIPVCALAAGLLDRCPGPWLFPGNGGRAHLGLDAVRAALLRGGYFGSFCARDLRRTWKTLAGQAGLSKLERDMLQNHGRSDVSARHYDRWESMPEKRAAVARWGAWLEQEVRGQQPEAEARDVVHGE